MKFVEPIRDRKKIAQIKNLLRGQQRYCDLLLFVIGINAALRISDLLQLRLSQFLDETGKIKNKFWIKERKRGERHEIAINQSMKEALIEYLEAYPFRTKAKDNYLFFNPRTLQPLKRGQAWKFITAICKEVGLRGNYGTHSLRKTWGYHAPRMQGVDLALIMYKLNHNSVAYTKRYLGITDDELQAIAQRLNLLISILEACHDRSKEKGLQTHVQFSLDELVPEDNFYRQLEAHIDLEFIRELVQDLFSPIGRPSIDPVVFFKLQLIAFFEDVRSDRQLMELVNLNLAHRWYLRYDLDEPVPDHSSLTKIRERYGLSVFQAFFEEIVEQCIEAGLVWGEELYFDSTKVLANAAISNMIPQAEFEAEHHLEQLIRSSEETHSFNKLVDKYDGKRLLGIRKPHYKRVADQKVSPVDPYASPMPATKGGAAVLGYWDHYVVDGGKARIILRALVTPASIMDNILMLDLTNWVCERWKIKPRIAVGDSKYGTVKNMTRLEQVGIKAYVPIPDLNKRNDFYPAEDFHYDPVNNQYICPQGHPLPLWSRRKSKEMFVYRSDKKLCNACPVKSKCTKSKSGRHIFRSFYQEYVEKVKTYHPTPEYQKTLSKRAFWVEPLFGEAKDFHWLRRFRLRGLLKVNIEGVMIAAGQNLKRLIKHRLEYFFWLNI